MWKEVIEILKARNRLGPTLRPQCLRHQETAIVVSKPEDFDILSPEGGSMASAFIATISLS